ncbi:short chain dehydrogenase [Coccidioides immitis RS]|uniref:Short chain dehydrogenase n=2 Tax=Coccidioides immitis TaxID=5501 RepID=J3KDX6_COCIM|nr:short chain dehydrogenase [Coccidioides immitis RS]EAS33627.3 short chain dehydrogenase [Coccidioides immitis RS]
MPKQSTAVPPLCGVNTPDRGNRECIRSAALARGRRQTELSKETLWPAAEVLTPQHIRPATLDHYTSITSLGKMVGRLEGKVAIVTGAGSGFGEAIAHAFVDEGAHVLVADIAVENGHRVVKDIEAKSGAARGSAVFVDFNCTSRKAWEDALELAKQKFGKLDIVVNNAGTTYRKKPSIEVTEDEFDKIIAVNVKSIYQSVAVVVPYFVERKSGVFLNTSSVAGTRVRPGQVFYGGTKGFLNTVWSFLSSAELAPCRLPDPVSDTNHPTPCKRRWLTSRMAQVTQGLAAEYGPQGLRFNSICPLRGKTGLLEMFSGVPDTPEERERFAQSVPLRRMSEPTDVANAAVYLASDEASFITGVNLPVDGGRLAV